MFTVLYCSLPWKVPSLSINLLLKPMVQEHLKCVHWLMYYQIVEAVNCIWIPRYTESLTWGWLDLDQRVKSGWLQERHLRPPNKSLLGHSLDRSLSARPPSRVGPRRGWQWLRTALLQHPCVAQLLVKQLDSSQTHRSGVLIYLRQPNDSNTTHLCLLN